MPFSFLYRRLWIFILTLVVGLGGSVAAGWLGHRAEISRRRQRLDSEMSLRLERLRAGLDSHTFILEAVSTHFEMNPPRTDAEYETYLMGMDPLRRYPGLRGVNLGIALSVDEVAEKVRKAREDRSLLPQGHPGFSLHPARDPDLPGPVFMVRFVHPIAGNATALGFDSASRPAQAEALIRAARTGTIAATEPVATAQDPDGPPAMILRKFLKNPATGKLWAYINTVWQPKASLAMLQKAEDPFDLQLVDLGLTGKPEPARPYFGPDLAAAGENLRTSRLDFGGRTLELRLRPKPGAPGFGPVWWPIALASTLGALTLLAAYRHWMLRAHAWRIQMNLESTERRLEAVLQEYPDLLVLLNADLTYQEAFTGRDSMLLMPKEQLPGRTLEETLPMPLAARVAEATRRLLATGEPITLEYELDLPGGTRHFEAHGVRLKPHGQSPPGAAWSVRDITIRKQAVLGLQQREEEFRRFFESAPSPLLISRLEDGTMLLANDALRRLIEYPEGEDLTGSTPDYYADPSERQAIVDRLQREGSLRNKELTLRTRRGVLRTVSISCDLIHMGGLPVLLSTFHDLTDQRRSEEALRQAQKLESLGLMAGGIAHDFNNLLAAIQGNLDLALMIEDRGEQVEHIGAAAAALQRAADLTRQLLAYSGKTPMRTGPVDLGALAQDMVDLLRISIPKGITLDLALPPDLPFVEGDRAQLQQVVMNLVTNAADAIGAEGRIEIRAGRVELEDLSPFPGQNVAAGPHAWLSVSDTGSGMSDEVRARIFDPFFTTKSQGRGLGLSAMQGILRAHHAGLQIESAPGIGSKFTLYFPALPIITAPSRPAQAPRPAASYQGRVLVVDDEEGLREATSALLEALGFEVRTACDGKEALALIAAEGSLFSLVMLDLTMPLLDGIQVLEQLRASHPALPVILCSGYTSANPPVMNSDPHLGFLPKPFTLADLRIELARRLPH